jgi:hypothetical protein
MLPNALTLTLSRPTGEGTAGGYSSLSQRVCGASRLPVGRKPFERCSLSHRMGEGRGEGNSDMEQEHLLSPSSTAGLETCVTIQ